MRIGQTPTTIWQSAVMPHGALTHHYHLGITDQDANLLLSVMWQNDSDNIWICKVLRDNNGNWLLEPKHPEVTIQFTAKVNSKLVSCCKGQMSLMEKL